MIRNHLIWSVLMLATWYSAPAFCQFYPEMTIEGGVWGPNESSEWDHATPPLHTDRWCDITILGMRVNTPTDYAMPCQLTYLHPAAYDHTNTVPHWSRHLTAYDCFQGEPAIITGQGFDGVSLIDFEGPPRTLDQLSQGVEFPACMYIDFEIDWFGDYAQPCPFSVVPNSFRLHLRFNERRKVGTQWVGNNRYRVNPTEPYRQGFSESHPTGSGDYFAPGQTFVMRVLPQDLLVYNPDGSYSHQRWTFGTNLVGRLGRNSEFDLASLRSFYTYVVVRVLAVNGDRADVSLFIGDPGLRGDWNRDGNSTPVDVFAFLADWFAGDARAAACDGDASECCAADIFAFLSAWFGGQ